MRFLKNHLDSILIGLIFLASFGSVLNNGLDNNIWLHLVSGKIILQHGIIHTDLLSYTQGGNYWYPYEWLFQVILFTYANSFGLNAIPYFTGFFTGLTTVGIYLNMRKVFKVSHFFSFLTTGLWFVSIYAFFVPRPQLLVDLLFVWEFFFLSLYRKSGKVWHALISLPIMWIWTNMHGSFFIGIYLIFAFAFLQLAEQLFFNQKKNPVFPLLLIGVVSIVISLLPPLWTDQYKLLMLFAKNSATIQIVGEWLPLTPTINTSLFYIYSSIGLLVICFGVFFARKNKKDALPLLVLLPFLITPYIASRNIFYGLTALIFILGWIISKLQTKKYLIIAGIVIALFLALFTSLIPNVLLQRKQFYPSGAVSFLKNYQLHGNMFNSDQYSDYFLYYLYPQYKVFIDGRFDVFLCCQLHDIQRLQQLAQSKDIAPYMQSLWNKYNISYVVMTKGPSYQNAFNEILSLDPLWKLVFWDDNAQIFMKNDGKNTDLIKELGATYATPYQKTPFEPNHLQEALSEYQRMAQISDSGKTENDIGLIFLKMNNIPEAKQHFEKALSLNSLFIPAYVNAAEIALQQHDITTAIQLYSQTIIIDPLYIQGYIRLGQLYIATGDTQGAKDIWNKGLSHVSDSQNSTVLNTLINKY